MILGNLRKLSKISIFLACFLVYQVKGIFAFPVMCAKGDLLLELAGIARHVRIMTCAHNATWRIAIIKGIRLSALTKAGAKGEFGTKLWKPLTRNISISVAEFNQAKIYCVMKGSQIECFFFVKRENQSTDKNLSDLNREPTKSTLRWVQSGA